MNVLVACEFSGVVREAFRKRGHNAWSCDIFPAEDRSKYHYQRRAEEVITYGADVGLEYGFWDLLICHPPCTDLAVSGARYFAEKIADGRQQRALDFVQRLLNAPVYKIALENPISIISSKIRKPNQILQPWQFGHPESKSTCLWLKNLPELEPTNILTKEGKYWDNQTKSGQNKLPPSADRWKLRSRTYQGIADAMAEQWGAL